MRKPPNKPDGIGQHGILASGNLELAYGRVESGEEPVLNENVGAGQLIEQCRFT